MGCRIRLDVSTDEMMTMQGNRFGRVWASTVFAALAMISLDNLPTATAQMFGPRSLGRTIRPQPAPGLTGNVGMLRNQRFIRGNRQRTDFVGSDRAETRAFVGMQQSGVASSVRSAVTGGLGDNDTSRQVNQPIRRASAQRPYDPRLEIGFDYLAQPPTDVAAEVTRQLSSLTAGVSVSMEGRTAILRGVVASAEERQMAEYLASFEPGVSNVRNELAVAGDKEVIPPPSPRQE